MQSEDLSEAPVTWGHFAEPDAFNNAERLLSAFFSASTVGLAICDQQLRYKAVNKTLAARNGIAAEAHLGKTIREILGPCAQIIEEAILRVFATGVPILNLEMKLRLPNREADGYWIENLFPIKDECGTVVQVGALVVEITERKELELELQKLAGDVQDERDRLRQLVELDSLLVTQPDFDIERVFPKISDLVRTVVKHEYASLSLRDPETQRLQIRVQDTSALSMGVMAGDVMIGDMASFRRAFEQNTPRVMDLHALPARTSIPEDHVQEMQQRGLTFFCSVPLMGHSGALGTLNFALGRNHKEGFSAVNLEFLKQVANQIARAMDNARAYKKISDLTQKLRKETIYLQEEIKSELNFGELVGESANLKRVLTQVEIVAPSDATALLLGETGTGKELIARAIHRLSKRREGSFIKLNCAAIPTGLLESELFGHEKGAFTGAISQKIGRLELADNGTLFLDEVGDIPLEIQPKLLRVLQDQEFERLGGTRTLRVNVRLIAATNRDLQKEVALGQFRRDLYYRLHVFPLRLPTLRERRKDIPIRMGKKIEDIPTDTMNALVAWEWPGNIRELENFIERSVILSTGTTLNVPLAELVQVDGGHLDNTLEGMERDHIVRVLRETGGVIAGLNGAAARLGMKRTTLQSKMQRLGISRREFES